MPYPISLELQQRPMHTLKQMQRLIMSRQMQQAIQLLQLPIMELSPIIEMELQQNPVLEQLSEDEDSQEIDNQQLEESSQESLGLSTESELSFDEHDFEIMKKLDEDFREHFSESSSYSFKRSTEQDKLQTYLENSIQAVPTLFEHLMRQAQESFKNEKEMRLAEGLIGSLDENGFLSSDLKELAILLNCTVPELEKVLEVIQTFHPYGIGGRNRQESLLIQLRCQGKSNALAYKIIENYFDDLIHNRIPAIKKGLHCTSEQIRNMIDHHISKLDLHPGLQISAPNTPYIIPDITLRQEDENLFVDINDETMPRLRLNAKYLRMLDDDNLNQETKDFIRKKIASAKWLLRNILQRNDTLEKIAKLFVSRQRDFLLNPLGKLVPLTMKDVADELQMHESTIARAVANKYIDTPRGLLPLRFFFTNAIPTNEGHSISSKTVRDLMMEILEKEDKRHPLSDEAISKLLKQKGILCARRTVAKYRALLSIGSAQQRRRFY